jgi:DNA (cytosine-5)-methyltransferase 1
MNELALCSGVGALSLGLQRSGIRTICYVERDPYRVNVLVQRIKDGLLHDAPIWDNVTTFDGRPWYGRVSLISSGFPCQPFSTAGSQSGSADRRYLWADIRRIVCEVRPRFVLLENMYGLLISGADRGLAPIATILADLAALGFDVIWHVLPAARFGAVHIRERLFLFAYSSQGRFNRSSAYLQQSLQQNLPQKRPQETPSSVAPLWDYISQVEQRLGEPCIFGDDNGITSRLDRLESVGESVYVPIAEYLGKCLMEVWEKYKF